MRTHKLQHSKPPCGVAPTTAVRKLRTMSRRKKTVMKSMKAWCPGQPKTSCRADARARPSFLLAAPRARLSEMRDVYTTETP